MSYFVIVFADTVQLFSFDSEEDATRHAEEWWSAFSDIKTLVAKVTSENIIAGDLKNPPHLKGRRALKSASVNPGDLDLLACLEHLVTEGGPDNFIDASRGGIAMDFSAGKGDSEIRWGILQDKEISGGH